MKTLKIALIAVSLTMLAHVAWSRQTILWLESVSHDCTFAPDDTIRMNIRLDSNQLPVDQIGMALVYNSGDFDLMRVENGSLLANWPELTASIVPAGGATTQVTMSGGGPAIPSEVSGYLATLVFVFKHCGPSLSTYHYQLCWTQLFGDFDESVQDVDERCGYIDVFPKSSNTGRLTVQSLYHTCNDAAADTVEVGLRVEQTTQDIDAAGLDIPYNAQQAEYVGFKRGDLTATWPFIDVAALPGNILRVGGFSANAIPAGTTGVFVTLRFVMHCCGSVAVTNLCTQSLVDDFAGMTTVCGALTCTPLATKPASWGYVKSLYR
jgi:hypothetical protein